MSTLKRNLNLKYKTGNMSLVILSGVLTMIKTNKAYSELVPVSMVFFQGIIRKSLCSLYHKRQTVLDRFLINRIVRNALI